MENLKNEKNVGNIKKIEIIENVENEENVENIEYKETMGNNENNKYIENYERKEIMENNDNKDVMENKETMEILENRKLIENKGNKDTMENKETVKTMENIENKEIKETVEKKEVMGNMENKEIIENKEKENILVINEQSIITKMYDKTLNGKIILMRHGETEFNKQFTYTGVKVKYDPKYLDSHLNSNGIKQATKASQKFKNFNIETIYVSPLYRSIETASIIVKNHPNKDNIICIVHPLLTEILSNMQNFTYEIEKTKEKFNMNTEIKVDWSIFDQYFPEEKEQNLYFFKYIDTMNEEKKNNEYKKIMDNYGKKKFVESIGSLGKILRGGRLESLNNLYKRITEFKEFLRQKYFDNNSLNNENDNDKKVVIVSHQNFGRIFTSKSCIELKKIKNYPKDSYPLKNCEAISVYI